MACPSRVISSPSGTPSGVLAMCVGSRSGGTAIAEPPATLLNPFGEDVPGPGGLVRSDVDWMRACGKWRSARRAFVATNLRVCRSNNRNRRSDRLVERSGGFFDATGQRPIPRPWRRTFWFVGQTIAMGEATALWSDPVVFFTRQARGLSHGRGDEPPGLSVLSSPRVHLRRGIWP